MSSTAYILAGIAIAWWAWLIWYICKPSKSAIIYNDNYHVWQLWLGSDVIFEHTFYSRVLEEKIKLGI